MEKVNLSANEGETTGYLYAENKFWPVACTMHK